MSVSLRGFLTIARNLSVSLARKGQGCLGQPLDQARLPGEAGLAELDPLEILTRSEAAEAVARAVQRLPEDSRTAFILRYYYEMGFEQIAAILGCTEGAARVRVTRAKQSVARALRAGLAADQEDVPWTRCVPVNTHKTIQII